MSRVVVLGGGISGLTAAYRLSMVAPHVHVSVLEAADRLGGIVRTVREDGFVVEAGPDSFLASKPAGLRLCRDLGMEHHLIGPTEENRGSFVLHLGHLHSLPEGLTGLVPSRLDPLLESDLFTPAGKTRLAREPEIPARAGEEDESLASFVRRRFGTEVYERLIEPLMAGIYAGDGSLLSLQATFPQLREMEREHGSVIRAIAARSAPPASGPTGFLAPRAGMEEIVEALERHLGSVELRRGQVASRIERVATGWKVCTNGGAQHPADAVILAVPVAIAGQIAGPVDAALGTALTSIPSASSATVSLAFRRDDIAHPLRGFGYVIPRVAGSPALACTWVSSKWAYRAPPEFALLRVFLGRYGHDVLLSETDDGLVALAREELRATLRITATPERRWVFRWPQVMPQYLVGHRETAARIKHRLDRLPGLYLAGNAYGGVGIPDCILGGEQAAGAALAHISGSPPPEKTGPAAQLKRGPQRAS